MPMEIDSAELSPFLYQQNDESEFKNNFILLKLIPYICSVISQTYPTFAGTTFDTSLAF